MKRIGAKWLVLVLASICVVAGLYGWSIISRGFSAKAEPSSVEAFVAQRLRRFAIPSSARALTNPVQASAEVLASAKSHYADHCAICHGNDGRGKSLIGQGLYPKPPDMTAASTQSLTDGEIYYIIENGIRFTGMPGFADEVGNEKSEESWQLVHFIRKLPSLTDEEFAEMKKLNPKSPRELENEERIRKFLQGEDLPSAETNHEHHH